MRRLFPLLALLVLLPVPSASLKANGESVDSNPAVHSIGINASNRNKTSPIAKVGLTISEEPEIHGATVFGSKPNQLHASEQPPSAEKNSCDDLPAVPDDEKCQFVREHCESDSRINYPLIYYCYVQPKGRAAQIAFMVFLMLVALPLLVCLLNDIADLWFAPTMCVISQSIPFMSPRFAGVTLVAMGNGAPDLSSNITALQTGQWGLSTGAITGAAMFVQCIVASEVIRIAGGVECNLAMMRDVLVYAISLIGVTLFFLHGVITMSFVYFSLGVYLTYVTWVFLDADAVVRTDGKVSRFSWTELRYTLLQMQWGQRRRISESGSIYEPLLSPEQPTPAAAGNLGILSMGSFLEAVGEGLCEGAQVPAGYVAAAAEASGLEQQPEETSPPKHWTTGGLHDGPPGLGNISPSIVCSDFVCVDGECGELPPLFYSNMKDVSPAYLARTLEQVRSLNCSADTPSSSFSLPDPTHPTPHRARRATDATGASPLLFPPPGLGHTHGGVQGGLAQGQGMAGSPAGGGRAGNHPGRQSMPGSTCRGRGLSHPSMVLDSRTYKLAVFADTLNCEVEVDVPPPPQEELEPPLPSADLRGLDHSRHSAQFFSYSLNPRQTQTQLVSGSSFIRPRATAQAAVAGARPPRLQWRLSTALPSTPTIADHVHDYDGFSNFRLPLKIQLDVVSEEGSMARSSRSVESNTAGTMSRGQSGNSGRRPSFPRNRSQASLLGPALSLRSKSYTLAGSGSSLAGLEAEIGGPYVPRTGGGGGGPVDGGAGGGGSPSLPSRIGGRSVSASGGGAGGGGGGADWRTGADGGSGGGGDDITPVQLAASEAGHGVGDGGLERERSAFEEALMAASAESKKNVNEWQKQQQELQEQQQELQEQQQYKQQQQQYKRLQEQQEWGHLEMGEGGGLGDVEEEEEEPSGWSEEAIGKRAMHGQGEGRGQPPKREETLLKDIHQRSLQKLDLEVAVEGDVEKGELRSRVSPFASSQAIGWHLDEMRSKDVEKEDSSTSEVESSSFYAGFEPVTKGRSLYKQVVHMATLGACEEWDELPTPLLILRIISCPLLLPVYFTLRATIPFVDPAGYNRYWLLVSMLLSPLTVCRYMDATSAVQLGAAAAIGCSLLAMVWAATYDTDPNMLPAVDFGTRFDFGTPFFSVVGFILGAMWIDTVASEAVGIIVLCAQLLNVHPSVMGLTLLAWGNSLGDLASNTAMAKQGFSNMALTACFASPLFNMLISFAFGAYSYFLTSGEPSMDIQLQLPVGLGCVFLLIYNFAIVAVGLFYNGIIPRRFYIFARTWYCLYLLVACYADFADFI